MTQASSTDEWRRQLGTALLAELPGETVVMRTTERTYTAATMYTEVFMGTDLGRQWLGEVLRAARDLIARRARDGVPTAEV